MKAQVCGWVKAPQGGGVCSISRWCVVRALVVYLGMDVLGRV